MSSSDSSASSSDPEIPPNRTKGKGKENGVKKSRTSNPPPVDARHGKNEGTHPRWKYEPPADAILVDHDVDAGGFDWDAVKDNDDVELWLMRIPEGVRGVYRDITFASVAHIGPLAKVKPKFLENVRIEQPSSSKSQRLGIMERKYATYDIWSMGPEDKEDHPVGGEEITGLSCLLPRRRKNGRVFQGENKSDYLSPL